MAFTVEDQQARDDTEHASPTAATEGPASWGTHTEERIIGDTSDSQAHEDGQGPLGAGQTKLPIERKKSITESPQPKAEAESEESRKHITAEQADLNREAEPLPSPAGDSATKDKPPHGPSVSSRPQESDTTPGAFPEYDDESVYSEVSSDREDARQSSGAENKASNSQPETVKESPRQNEDDYEDQPAQESRAGRKVQPTVSIQPNNLDTSGKHLNKETEHLDDHGEKQARSSTNFPGNFPVHESHANVGPVPKPPSRLRGTSSASAKAGTEQWLNSPLRQQAPITEFPNTSMKAAEEDATQESPNIAVGDRKVPDHGAGGEEATRGPRIAQPLASNPSSVPFHTDRSDNEEEGRSVLNTEQVRRGLAPVSKMEELTGSNDPETSHESKQYGRPITTDASPNIKVDQEMESRPKGSQGSNPEPAGVIRRASTMPISMNARKSSEAAKTVTLPPPKIFVQSPSEFTQDEPIGPHPTPAEPAHNDEYRITSRNGSVVSVQHTVRSAAEKLGPARTGKRRLYLRKVRNLAARKVFLNATLGRKMGSQTKDRLRRLARGEEVPSPSISTEPPAADSPPLKKRKSFIRKARNLAARQVFLDAALGRQVGGETKPALQRLANGESIVFDEG